MKRRHFDSWDAESKIYNKNHRIMKRSVRIREFFFYSNNKSVAVSWISLVRSFESSSNLTIHQKTREHTGFDRKMPQSCGRMVYRQKEIEKKRDRPQKPIRYWNILFLFSRKKNFVFNHLMWMNNNFFSNAVTSLFKLQ